MSSIPNMLNIGGGDGLLLVTFIPIIVVFAVVILLKFSMHKREVVKKHQNARNLQIVYANKPKEDKSHHEKKGNVVKDKKTSYIGNSIETQTKYMLKTNKKQQATTKRTQTKKQHVNSTNTKNLTTTNNNEENNKKQLDIFINKEEEGEWQMVTTKKQKQKPEGINEVESPSKVSKKSLKSQEKARKESNKIKTPKAGSENAIVKGDIMPTEISTEKLQSADRIQSNDAMIVTTTPLIPENTTDLDFSSNISYTFNENEDPKTTNPDVAFNESGDDGWTKTKFQKKNRKRALRE